MPALQDRPQNTEEHVDLGSQRARQGQNVKGMRKVLVVGILLTVIAFAALLLGYAAWESDDPSPQADLASESNPEAAPALNPSPGSTPEPDPGAVGSAPGTTPQTPGVAPDGSGG
jgi:hypothetical protein